MDENPPQEGSGSKDLGSSVPSMRKRSRLSIMCEPAAPPPSAPNVSLKHVRWFPLRPQLDWNTIQQPPLPRMGHRAVMLNSKLIIFGGGNQQINRELLVFDIRSNTWSMPPNNGDVPRGRAAYGMDTLGNHIYIFGGMVEHGNYVNELYRLDVSSWTWTKLNPRGPIPCPRFGHSFTRLNGSFYVFGGLTDDAPIPPQMPRYLEDFFKLNVSSNLEEITWEIPHVFGSMPGPRESHSAVAYSCTISSLRYNRLIIYGGMCGWRLDDLYMIDADTLAWTKPTVRGIPPAPRSMHSANVVGNRMYIFGGWTPVTEQPHASKRKDRKAKNVWEVTSELLCLNLEELRWEPVVQRAMQRHPVYWPKARAGHCAAAAGPNIYIWGGKDGFNVDEQGRQVCLQEMLKLVVEKPGVPGKMQLVGADSNTLVVKWDAVEGADSYVIQCCPIDPPVLMPPPAPPVQVATVPQPPNRKPLLGPIALPVAVKPQSHQMQQVTFAPCQPMTINQPRGPHASTTSVPDSIPTPRLVLVGADNRLPSQNQQYRHPTGQTSTSISLSQDARQAQPVSRTLQPQHLQPSPRPSQFQSQGFQLLTHPPRPPQYFRPFAGPAQYFQTFSEPPQFQRIQWQQQQQPVMNFVGNPNQFSNYQLRYSNIGGQQGVQGMYFISQPRPDGGWPAYVSVPHPTQQQQQQRAITSAYFGDPSQSRPNITLASRMPTSGPISMRSPQLGVGFRRLPQVPLRALAPRPSTPLTLRSSAATPAPPPPPSRRPPPSSSE